MKIKNKKGIQLNQAFASVLMLVLIGVLVIISIYIFSALGTSMLTRNTSGSGVNETITITNAGTTLFGGTLIDGNCGTITLVTNISGYTLNTGNYTQVGCVISNKTATAPYGTSWNISYPYTYSATTSAYNASGTMITNFSGYPALVGLVGTIIFLGIVIGVLVASFVFGGKKGA